MVLEAEIKFRVLAILVLTLPWQGLDKMGMEKSSWFSGWWRRLKHSKSRLLCPPRAKQPHPLSMPGSPQECHFHQIVSSTPMRVRSHTHTRIWSIYMYMHMYIFICEVWWEEGWGASCGNRCLQECSWSYAVDCAFGRVGCVLMESKTPWTSGDFPGGHFLGGVSSGSGIQCSWFKDII